MLKLGVQQAVDIAKGAGRDGDVRASINVARLSEEPPAASAPPPPRLLLLLLHACLAAPAARPPARAGRCWRRRRGALLFRGAAPLEPFLPPSAAGVQEDDAFPGFGQLTSHAKFPRKKTGVGEGKSICRTDMHAHTPPRKG